MNEYDENVLYGFNKAWKWWKSRNTQVTTLKGLNEADRDVWWDCTMNGASRITDEYKNKPGERFISALIVTMLRELNERSKE